MIQTYGKIEELPVTFAPRPLMKPRKDYDFAAALTLHFLKLGV